MNTSIKIAIAAGILVVGAGFGLYAVFRDAPPPAPVSSDGETAADRGAEAKSQEQISSYRRFRSREASAVSPAFDFSAEIPIGWEVEAVPAIEALNIYDPTAQGATHLEQSKIFIRYFRADKFLTLSTVSILKRETQIVIGRPAVNYLIEKKSGVPNFPHQPSWRNTRHRVTDIRVSDASPSVFYVFAKRPDLSDEEFERFLQSLDLDPASPVLFYPMEGFLSGITKKHFGVFVEPGQSPVSQERFRGWHTGADAETDGQDPDKDIPISAIAEGTVAVSKNASGYGGVLAIRHAVGKRSVLAIYGHLRSSSMPAVDARVSAGEKIAVLGKGFSPETDGERRHLHFGLYRGEDIAIAGYAAREGDLAQWYDPVVFFLEFPNIKNPVAQ